MRSPPTLPPPQNLERAPVQYGIMSIHYAGAKLWNSVLYEIRLAFSVKKFRSEQKVYLIKSYVKFLICVWIVCMPYC